jgi:hypothetical protein
MVNGLVATKEAIKRGKDYIISLPSYCSAIGSFLCEKIISNYTEWNSKLNLLYLTNEVLLSSRKARKPEETEDLFSVAFLPFLPSIIYATYNKQPTEKTDKIYKVLENWVKKGIFSEEAVRKLQVAAHVVIKEKPKEIVVEPVPIVPVVVSTAPKENKMEVEETPLPKIDGQVADVSKAATIADPGDHGQYRWDEKEKREKEREKDRERERAREREKDRNGRGEDLRNDLRERNRERDDLRERSRGRDLRERGGGRERERDRDLRERDRDRNQERNRDRGRDRRDLRDTVRDKRRRY